MFGVWLAEIHNLGEGIDERLFISFTKNSVITDPIYARHFILHLWASSSVGKYLINHENVFAFVLFTNVDEKRPNIVLVTSDMDSFYTLLVVIKEKLQ